MTDQVLPASPNWYCSRVCDCDHEKTLVFGGRSSLYVFDISVSPLRHESSWQAHHERLVGVSLCHAATPGDRWCCTAGEDKKVRLWNLDSRTMLNEHMLHKSNPTTVHWSPCSNGPVVSGDDRGGVVAWWPQSEASQLMVPEKNPVFSLTCSPHTERHVAVGYKSGVVLLLDVSEGGGILQRLKGHDDEIHCLVWAPVLGNVTSQESDITAEMLATSSRDGTIRVWKRDSDRPINILRVHAVGRHGKQGRQEEYGKPRLWVTLHWRVDEPAQLLSSGHNGDVMQWNLKESRPHPALFTAGQCRKSHQRIVFNICSGGASNHLYTISMDRQIIVWDLEKQKSLYSLSTLGGFAYCMALSPLNPDQIAIGVGDAMIRLWNMNSQYSPYDCLALWQGIKSKVTALSWHPEREGSLGYGTEDGRVGMYNVLSAKGCQVSSTYHKRTVYGVCWGPPLVSNEGGESTSYVLYSVGDGEVLQHRPYQLDKPARKLLPAIKRHSPHTSGCSELQWKPDFTVAALGYEDGVIEVVRASDVQVLCSIRVHHKLINCLAWHPPFTADSTVTSPCHAWLASGSNEPVIHVFDLKKVLESSSEEAAATVTVTESLRVLEGHGQRITSLCWSTHSPAQLASASYDATAQVWNAESGELVANYRAHSGRLFSVLWSLTQPDLVFTAGDDFTVRAWKPSAQEHKTPPTKKKKVPTATLR